MKEIKYSDLIGKWLKQLGYTHYFYVGGGNIMHLTESLDRYLKGVPVIHEVAAGIAAEYFNEISSNKEKALALVTTGPGLTNIVTAVSGAWLESRELLVIGGQVKTSDLASTELRGRGIQEIKGVDLLNSTTKLSVRLDRPVNSDEFENIVSESWKPRKGPVFIEFPLDVQAKTVIETDIAIKSNSELQKIGSEDFSEIVDLYNKAKNPILLIGGGLDYSIAEKVQKLLEEKGIPTMTTYNGADRVDGYAENYLGRPNTWGQRSSNIIIQQSDLILAVGTRLGMQQTGFNWQEFGRNAQILQLDIDQTELDKGHPYVDKGYACDANDFVIKFVNAKLERKDVWLLHAQKIRAAIPRVEPVNNTGENFISPYEFITTLEQLSNKEDLIIPCSSGSAFTLSKQLYKQKFGQRMLTNKSLASMGYGLSGAIGACIGAKNLRRTILIEGDGGFAQNMQEIGTAAINNLNLKMFIFDDQGHASIRMTQKNYFNGKYLGCDVNSGLGLPKWESLFTAWNVDVVEVNKGFEKEDVFLEKFNNKKPVAFIVKIDPEQTYYPKISSRVTKTGSMESNSIDIMTPEIDMKALLEYYEYKLI